MWLMQQLLASAIPMFAYMLILFYFFQRFLAATRLRRKIMTEMREFSMIVRRARDNLRYIGQQVTKGMDEIREDVGKELRVTDRLTTQSTKLAAVLRRFASLEENVIELVRMDRNRESVRIETPEDVTEEIERIVASSTERRKKSEESDELTSTREHGRNIGPRNPISKFSTRGSRETAAVASAAAGTTTATAADAINGTRKTMDGRIRIATTPEVRLLGESNRPQTFVPIESNPK